MSTLSEHIHVRTADYAALPLFRAFAEDRVPLERFADFFREQYMTARLFQDLIWATTEIHDGPYAAFARSHRARDSGHHKWMKQDLAAFGLEMTADDFFRLEWLGTRTQMARILAHLSDATPERRMVVLAALESAGAVTLGTLFDYVARHGLTQRLHYLGSAHVDIERGQVDALAAVAKELFASDDAEHKATVDLVFHALGTMFGEGGERYYGDLVRRAS